VCLNAGVELRNIVRIRRERFHLMWRCSLWLCSRAKCACTCRYGLGFPQRCSWCGSSGGERRICRRRQRSEGDDRFVGRVSAKSWVWCFDLGFCGVTRRGRCGAGVALVVRMGVATPPSTPEHHARHGILPCLALVGRTGAPCLAKSSSGTGWGGRSSSCSRGPSVDSRQYWPWRPVPSWPVRSRAVSSERSES
jgi:hypothetical protein